MKKSVIIGVVLLVLFVIGVLGYGAYSASQPAKYEAFAECMVQKQVKFYGAFWCPHCAQQEADLQMTREHLASIGLYFECSTPDGQGQTQTCTDIGISGYPTWVLPDGTRLNGVQTLAALASSTGCTLPQ